MLGDQEEASNLGTRFKGVAEGSGREDVIVTVDDTGEEKAASQDGGGSADKHKIVKFTLHIQTLAVFLMMWRN